MIGWSFLAKGKDHMPQSALDIHDLLQKRWSPRAFADRPVEISLLKSCLEAACSAPSSFNAQPWSYIVATRENPEEFKRLLGCLVERNQMWAAKAPVLMISVANTIFAHNGQPNLCAQHDVGAASAFFTLQATHLGLYVHQMGGIVHEKIKQTYGLPAQCEPIAGLAVGYLGDAKTLPEDFQKMEGGPGKTPRKGLAEFVYAGKWGQAAPWVKG
jgi:nitroreductase